MAQEDVRSILNFELQRTLFGHLRRHGFHRTNEPVKVVKGMAERQHHTTPQIAAGAV